MSAIREHVVGPIREQIARGEYLTDDKIDVVVDKLHRKLFRDPCIEGPHDLRVSPTDDSHIDPPASLMGVLALALAVVAVVLGLGLWRDEWSSVVR